MKIKRIIALVLTAVMLISCIGVCYAAGEGEYTIVGGDVNVDGKYNLFDVSMLMKYIAGWDLSGVADEEHFEMNGDVNGDGNVNLGDAAWFMKCYAWWSRFEYLD